jgi:hypothetical protein
MLPLGLWIGLRVLWLMSGFSSLGGLASSSEIGGLEYFKQRKVYGIWPARMEPDARRLLLGWLLRPLYFMEFSSVDVLLYKILHDWSSLSLAVAPPNSVAWIPALNPFNLLSIDLLDPTPTLKS